jgi:hypothetical protein
MLSLVADGCATRVKFEGVNMRLGAAPEGNPSGDILVEAAARHEVACVEWSVSSQPSVQGCLQSLSASLVTVE